MAKFHVNSSGDAGECHAEKGGCPFGGATDHFTSKEAARKAFEEKQASAGIAGGLSKKNSGTSGQEEIYVHPQGKEIRIDSAGVVTAFKNGLKAKTSATAEQLRAGYGRWTKVESNEPSEAPQLSLKDKKQLFDDFAKATKELKDVKLDFQSYSAQQRQYDAIYGEAEGRAFHYVKGYDVAEGTAPVGNTTFFRKSEAQEKRYKEFAKSDAGLKLRQAQTNIELAGLGHELPDQGNTIRVRTQAQKVALTEELQGQISDGHWENSNSNAWSEWSNAHVIVDPKNPGRNFNTTKDNYNLNSSELLSVVGDRMVETIKRTTGDDSFDSKKLRANLADLKTIFKIKRSNRSSAD